MSTKFQNLDEFELSFIYAVESTREKYDYIDDLEDWILYFIAKSTLSCADANSPHLLRSPKEDGRQPLPAGVVKVQHSQDGEVTSRTACDPVAPFSTGCAIWRTRIVITSLGLPVSEVRHDTLLSLLKSLNNGTFAFVKYMPDIISTTYLGPHPDAWTIAKLENVDKHPPQKEGTTTLLIITVSIGVACVTFYVARRLI